LARELDIKRSGKPALKKPRKFTNYAFGRARARDPSKIDATLYFDRFGLDDQRGHFLTDFGGVAPADATYVIWIGANDVRDGLEAAGDLNRLFTTDEIFEAALFAIASHISKLWMAGARNFLVLNVLDLSITPAILSRANRRPFKASRSFYH